MTLLSRERFKGVVAVGLVLLVSCLGIPAARAAGPDPAGAGQGDTTAQTVPEEPAAGPAVPPRVQLQLQDEGPSAADRDRAQLIRRRAVAAEPEEQRPFWKSWVFWTVTGVLVAGAVSLVAYTSSQNKSNLAPCPPEVLVSLGCYGAGR